MFQKIGVISLPVKDQDRAKSFFTEVLQFEVVRDDPYTDDARWIELALPNTQTSIALTTWFKMGPLAGLVLKTDDVQAAYEVIKNSAADGVTEVESAPWGSSFMFSDTEGNGWIVQQDAA